MRGHADYPYTVHAQAPPADAPGGEVIGSVRVDGDAWNMQINAGGKKHATRIGRVEIGGDWIAGSIAAGTRSVGDGQSRRYGVFGDFFIGSAGDPEWSRIGEILIHGRAVGDRGHLLGNEFMAQEIGRISIGGTEYDIKGGKSGPLDDSSKMRFRTQR